MSQVKPTTIQLFFSDVQALCLQMLASTTTSISISDNLWETLETVFGCTDIILGSVWSTSSCRDGVLHQAEFPFVPKRFSLADIRYSCSVMLPAFHSMTSCCVVLRVSHLHQFFITLPMNHCYLALIPFSNPFSATLQQWEAQGYAIQLASQISIRKVVSTMPRGFTGDGICQWWMILPGMHCRYRLVSNTFYVLAGWFGNMVATCAVYHRG